MKQPSPWTLAEIWNTALVRQKPRSYEPRERIWASELYGADIDLYLKLNGVQPSNEPNKRSLRKFEAGNMHEWFIKLVLVAAGIYKSSQDRIEVQLEEKLLPVSGKIDFYAGGHPELHESLRNILGNMELPELYQRQAEALVQLFQEKYPNGLEEKILEIKSVAATVFDRIEQTGKAIPGHEVQAYHYAHGTGKRVTICYLCRDDLRMYEVDIMPNDPNLHKRYKDRVKAISEAFRGGVEPSPEPLVVYDPDMGRFSKNFKVEYSSYLTRIYGFKEPREYSDRFAPMIKSWNYVLGRIAKNKNMTPKNMEALKQIESFGFNLDEIKNNLSDLASKGVDTSEEETDE